MNVAHMGNRKRDDIDKALLLMLEYNDRIDVQCRCLWELLHIIEWYYLDQSRGLSQVSITSQDDYYKAIINYDVLLDNLNNNISILVKNIIDHFEFEDEDMQCIIDVLRSNV